MGFNVIDQIIVGFLGANAVAAVGLSNSVASIALLLYASAGVGAGVMVARAFGRKDLGEVSRITAAARRWPEASACSRRFCSSLFPNPSCGWWAPTKS